LKSILSQPNLTCKPGIAQIACPITPVPGGVGPMTIAMLMRNTLKAAELTLGR